MYKERIESCGQRIAKALDINGMKQAELCKLAKVPKSSLSLYLSGAYEPKQNRIYDMARVLNVSEAWLMGYRYGKGLGSCQTLRRYKDSSSLYHIVYKLYSKSALYHAT